MAEDLSSDGVDLIRRLVELAHWPTEQEKNYWLNVIGAVAIEGEDQTKEGDAVVDASGQTNASTS